LSGSGLAAKRTIRSGSWVIIGGESMPPLSLPVLARLAERRVRRHGPIAADALIAQLAPDASCPDRAAAGVRLAVITGRLVLDRDGTLAVAQAPTTGRDGRSFDRTAARDPNDSPRERLRAVDAPVSLRTDAVRHPASFGRALRAAESIGPRSADASDAV
jgi:hypothetical protein